MPLWLGETGENVSEWFTAMYPLAAELGIGYNIWPWKKMRTQNSPCSIRKPEGWDAILEYSRGGKLPDRTEAQKALDEYLDNMLLENCDENIQLHDAIFRRPGAVMRATDFDELGGAGVSYLCRRKVENPFSYRTDSGMEIVETDPNAQKEFGFDCLWRRFTLGLEAGEFACYTLFDIPAGAAIAVTLTCRRTARLRIEQDETELGEWGLSGENVSVTLPNVPLHVSDRSVLRIRVDSGRVELEKITTFR